MSLKRFFKMPLGPKIPLGPKRSLKSHKVLLLGPKVPSCLKVTILGPNSTATMTTTIIFAQNIEKNSTDQQHVVVKDMVDLKEEEYQR